MTTEQLKTEGWQYLLKQGKYEDDNHKEAYKHALKALRILKTS